MSGFSLRGLLAVACSGCLLCLQSAMVKAQAAADSKPIARGEIVVSDRAREIHARATLIDGHNDLPWKIREQGSPGFEKMDISQSQPKLDTDIPRTALRRRQGAVLVRLCAGQHGADGKALSTTLEQIALVKAMINRYPEVFEFAGSVDDIERIYAAGRIASLIGVEGGHSIENSLNVLRELYAQARAT